VFELDEHTHARAGRKQTALRYVDVVGLSLPRGAENTGREIDGPNDGISPDICCNCIAKLVSDGRSL